MGLGGFGGAIVDFYLEYWFVFLIVLFALMIYTIYVLVFT